MGRSATAAALDLVHCDEKSGSYVFKHALVRDALRDELARRHPARDSIGKCRGRGRATERKSDRGSRAECLAHHYARTNLADKAFSLPLRGRQEEFLRSIRLDEADRHFRQALRLVDSDPHVRPPTPSPTPLHFFCRLRI